MSILDSELILSGTVSSGTWTGQRISASGATASTDYIDTLAAGDAIKGAVLKIVSTAIMAGTGTTLTCALTTDSDSAFGTETTLFSTGAIAKASTAANTVLAQVVIPVGVKRYLRIVYTADNTFETTGRVFAAIIMNPEKTLDRQL
jgi:hypothetical protein